MNFYKLICLAFTILFCQSLYSADASVSISSSSETTSVGEPFNVVVSAQGSYKTFNEPEFKNFSVENRSHSTSTSISIINGKMKRTKSVSYTYRVSALESGVFTIGPASLTLNDGSLVKSNTVSITVLPAPVVGAPKGDDRDRHQHSGEKPSDIYSKTLNAPLSEWEKRTPEYFVRTVIKPDVDFYEGEPVTVSYYIFTKPGAISNIAHYEPPLFENCWQEEISRSRLNFQRTVIEGRPYDYSLLKTFILIPEKGVDVLRGTQMVIDVTTGSFFNVRRRKISSPAVNIPLKPLPESKRFLRGTYGNFEMSVDKEKVKLNSENLLDSVTFTLKGCGNLHSPEIDMKEVDGLQIFPPDVKVDALLRDSEYCGEKTFTYMIKGVHKGVYVLGGGNIDFYSRDKGWYSINIPEVTIDVMESSPAATGISRSRDVKFEVLKELPEGLPVYGILMITQRIWFRVVLIIPFILMLASLFIWFIKSANKRFSTSFSSKLKYWEKCCVDAKDTNELMNTMYDALSSLYSIELRGERRVNVEKKYGSSLNAVCELIKDLQYCTYSANKKAELDVFKEKALKLLNPGIYKK